MKLDGSCRCGALHFTVSSSAPYPYRICYCARCRKIAGGTGAAINILADADTLTVENDGTLTRYQDGDGGPVTAFCSRCGSALFVELAAWPRFVYPFASAIDTPLPVPPHFIHIQLRERADWVPLRAGPDDAEFETNTDESIAAWHQRMGLTDRE